MKRLIGKICLTLGLLLTATTTSPAQNVLGPKDGAGLPPSDLTRIKVGDVAPDFTLEDQDGQPVTLSAYREKQTVVLVFYRGSW